MTGRPWRSGGRRRSGSDMRACLPSRRRRIGLRFRPFRAQAGVRAALAISEPGQRKQGQRTHVEKGMFRRTLSGGALRWNAAEVIDNAGDGGEQARRNTSRHQISGNGFQILILRKRGGDTKAPCAGEKRKRKRDEHWVNRMRRDGSCAFHARDCVQIAGSGCADADFIENLAQRGRGAVERQIADVEVTPAGVDHRAQGSGAYVNWRCAGAEFTS